MKNTLITAFILVFLQLPTFGVTPITDGQLQNDLDANGNNITNLEGLRFTSSAVSKMGRAKDIWIAVRTDGIAGSGTEIDPFNCGGANATAQADKLDAILTTYQPNYNIHWASGTYYTRGWRFDLRKTAGTGVKHFGAGMGQTIVKLFGASNSTGDGVVFGHNGNDQRADGFELHNLTIDADATNQGKWGTGSARFVDGVHVAGSNIVVEKVEVIHFGSNSSGAESFPLSVYGAVASSDYSNNLADGCYVHSPVTGGGSGDGCSALLVGGAVGVNGITGTNNIIRNCTVDLTGNNFPYSHGPYAQIVENNYVRNVATGYYNEPGVSGGNGTAIIRNNTFVNVGGAVASAANNGVTWYSYVVENNVCIDVQGGLFASGVNDSFVHLKHLIIRGNSYYKSDGTVDTHHVVFCGNTGPTTEVANAVVQNNTFDSNDADAIYLYATNANVSNNHRLDGTLVGYTLNGTTAQQKQAVEIPASGDASTSQVVKGNDSRLTNTRTPTDNTASTAKIVDSAVTTAKLASSSVTAAKIADGNVTTSKLADGAVTNDKAALMLPLTIKGNAKDSEAAPGDLAFDNAQRTIGIVATFKGVTTTRTTSSASDDPDLQIAVNSGEVWEFRFSFGAKVNSASSAGIKMNFNGPSVAYSQLAGFWRRIDTGELGQTEYPSSAISYSDTSLYNTGAGIHNYNIFGTVLVKFSASGTFRLQWGQLTTSATGTDLNAGSYMIGMRLQ